MRDPVVCARICGENRNIHTQYEKAFFKLGSLKRQTEDVSDFFTMKDKSEHSPLLISEEDANVASNASSFRERLSSAGSYLSLMLESPKRYLEDRSGFLLALTSGLLLTLYSTLYKRIADDIAKVSVLVLRGGLQAREFPIIFAT